MQIFKSEKKLDLKYLCKIQHLVDSCRKVALMRRRLANLQMLAVRIWNEATIPTVTLRCKGCKHWKLPL